MSRAFRREGVGYSETELADNFWAMSIDPQRALDEYLGQQVGGALSGLLFNNRIFEYFVAAAPGVRELTTIGKVWELAQLERRDRSAAPYDLVILDAPASGHGLAMLRAPRTFGEIARVGPIRRRADMIDEFLRDPARTGRRVGRAPAGDAGERDDRVPREARGGDGDDDRRRGASTSCCPSASATRTPRGSRR